VVGLVGVPMVRRRFVVPSNPPVNADARARATMCVRCQARAGYRAR
jgi:hypothetical protein